MGTVTGLSEPLLLEGSRRRPPSWLRLYAVLVTLACIAFAIALIVVASQPSDDHDSSPDEVWNHRKDPATFKTDWPSVGVLSLPSSSHVGLDYIPASYIRWLEASGVIAVPVPSGVYWNKTSSTWRTQPQSSWSDATYDRVFDSINGLLLPGGDPWPQVSSPAFQRLYRRAVAANNHSDHFPIWGTCAGFETLVVMAEGGCESCVSDGNIPTGSCGSGPIVRGFDAENLSLPLQFMHPQNTKLMATAPMSLISAAASMPITFNNHKGGVTAHEFQSSNVSRVLRAVATSTDRSGTPFVALMEGKELPFYGAQFHPEKTMYEWGVASSGVPYENINHGEAAIALSQYFANFVAKESRKSSHRFENFTALIAASMYNYQPSVYKPGHPSDMQVYYLNWSAQPSILV